MGFELENVWDAMKGVHYQRTIEQLERTLRDSKQLKDALNAALDTVVTAARAEAGTFWFYDRFGDGRIRPKAVYGGGDLGDLSLLPGEGVAGQVIASGEPVIIEDCQKDPRWAGKADEKTGFTTKTMICVPLSFNHMVFGSIQIINRLEGAEGFDDKDLDFAMGLAGATADLFRKQGLLDDYIQVDEGRPAREEVTFNDIFFAKNERDMEDQLRRVDAMSTLRVADQDTVLKLTREVYQYFGGAVSRRRRFGFGRK